MSLCMKTLFFSLVQLTYPDYRLFLLAWMALAVVTFLVLLRVTAPYGRHTSAAWGPQISNRWGWIIMEAPVMIVLLWFVFTSMEKQTAATWVMIGMFCFHYIHRTFIFPFRIHTRGKKMPLVIVMSAVTFNLVNGFGLGYFFAHFATYTDAWFQDPRFWIGSAIFFAGWVINFSADNALIRLRKPGDTHYVIPRGPIFQRISCPNLAGEWLEWLGYAVLCWNLPALAFFVWTSANLIPRAISHHRWYKQKFPDYPKERKAMIPFLI